MGVSRPLARNARTVFEFSAARFGQARAITNARHEATRMSRQRVEREDEPRRVSLEVSPLLAHDTDATLAEAQDIWKAVDRPNLLVKIPATQEGLSAITSARFCATVRWASSITVT